MVNKFVNEEWPAQYIHFYAECSDVIQRVTRGEINAPDQVKVERVVDIVQQVFKHQSLINGEDLQYAQLSSVMTQLLMNSKIEYHQGQGFLQANELQIQLLVELDKLVQRSLLT